MSLKHRIFIIKWSVIVAICGLFPSPIHSPVLGAKNQNHILGKATQGLLLNPYIDKANSDWQKGFFRVGLKVESRKFLDQLGIRLQLPDKVNLVRGSEMTRLSNVTANNEIEITFDLATDSQQLERVYFQVEGTTAQASEVLNMTTAINVVRKESSKGGEGTIRYIASAPMNNNGSLVGSVSSAADASAVPTSSVDTATLDNSTLANEDLENEPRFKFTEEQKTKIVH